MVVIGVAATDSLYVSFILLGIGNMEIMTEKLEELSVECRQVEGDREKEKIQKLSSRLTELIEMHQDMFQ